MKNNDINNLNPDFRLNKKNNNIKNIFFKTFSLTLILMAIGLYFFTPNIDVQIGDISSDNEFEEEIDYVNKKNVDYRLRWIQLEDNGSQLIDKFKKNETDIDELNNAMSDIDSDIEAIEQSDSAHNDNSLPLENQQLSSNVDGNTLNEIHLSNDNTQPTQVKNTFSKVYIGSYNDINTAIEIQNKVIETNLPISPFIKKINNEYVIQVGSFANLGKAQTLVNQLAQQGFQARIIEE